MRIFVAGTGFTGSRILQKLEAAGHEVCGLNRKGESPGSYPVLAGDVLEADSLKTLDRFAEVDLFVSTLSGTGLRDPGQYRALYVDGPRRMMDRLKWRTVPRVWMLGSTGVYGEKEGEWVHEETPVNPRHPAGIIQVEAEKALADAADHTAVLRLSGLYGPGRTRLIRQALRKRPFLKPETWSNNIHADDVAGLILFLVESGVEVPPALLVSDSEPALRKDIFTWVRKQAGLPEGLLNQDHPDRAKADRGNKRVSSRKMKDLGYRLIYPTFRQGLLPLVKAELSAAGGSRESFL